MTTLSIKVLYVTVSISDTLHYAECRILFIILLNVIMLSVVMVSVVMLSVIKLSVVEPFIIIYLRQVILDVCSVQNVQGSML